MRELALVEVEQWYIDELEQVFFKEKKILKKNLEKLDKFLVNLNHAVSKIKEREQDVELEEKMQKYLDRFYLKVKDNLESIEIPDNPQYNDVTDLLNDFKKLFTVIHDAGRKNIKYFSDHFKLELKEIDLITRKIGEQMGRIDDFLRKKYGTVKDAENTLKKIPKIMQIIDRIEKSKGVLDNFKNQKEELKTDLQNLEDKIIEIENNEIIIEKQKVEKQLLDLRMRFHDKLKFKKALKKLKRKLEGSGSFKGITLEKLKKYISNPINTIVRDGENHPKLNIFLIQLRYLLESQGLQLKNEVRNKTLQNIEKIVSKGFLKEDIRKYIVLSAKNTEFLKKSEESKLTSQLKSIKEKVSIRTQELEHLNGDIKHKSNEYRGLLEKLKDEREILQRLIKNFVDQDVKIQITLKAQN